MPIESRSRRFPQPSGSTQSPSLQSSPPPTRLPVVERARRYLAALPAAVSGEAGHDATFRAACALLHGFSLDESTAYALLSEWNTRCRPPWSPNELIHKIQSAQCSPSTRPHGYLTEGSSALPAAFYFQPSKWPDPDQALIAPILAAGPSALELWKRSPRLLDVDDGSNCEEILSALFATPAEPDPLLCIGQSNREFATRPLSEWLAEGNLCSRTLVVPSPMTARTGHTKNGTVSAHTLENTGSRRFLVVEFDKGSADDHAARLWHLRKFAALAAVVHSGGKSLHGWFACGHWSEEEQYRFMVYAVRLGADKATWTRSQFVRLPAGLREGGCRQSVFYFDPSVANPAAANTSREVLQ